MKRKTILGVMIVAFLPLIVGDGVVDLPAHIHVDSSTEIVPPTRLLLAATGGYAPYGQNAEPHAYAF
jgi:hypothetical protein